MVCSIAPRYVISVHFTSMCSSVLPSAYTRIVVNIYLQSKALMNPRLSQDYT
jgi:hypothetical protein